MSDEQNTNSGDKNNTNKPINPEEMNSKYNKLPVPPMPHLQKDSMHEAQSEPSRADDASEKEKIEEILLENEPSIFGSSQDSHEHEVEPNANHDDSHKKDHQVKMTPAMDEEETKVVKKSATVGFISGVVGAIVVVLLFWFLGPLGHPSIISQGADPANITINAQGEDATLASAVAKKALPSVVSIYVETPQGIAGGSGVILDKEGYILTNYHVVEGAKKIEITIQDKKYQGQVTGSDPSSDLAVVKADIGNAKIVPIEIGDSADLQVGDWVMSIGSPFGLDQSVSSGIVSSLYRNTMLPSANGNTIYSNLIQTDAAMNPGNSGGALVNAKGQLVGINSIIQSSSGNNAGVGFAIPGNYAVKVANTIIAGKQPVHPYFGATLLNVTPELARAKHIPVDQGAYVQEVTPGSPAEKAGIKSGDVIIGIDKEQITTAGSLILSVRSREVGQKINVIYIHKGREVSTELTLGSDENIRKPQDVNKSPFNLEDFLFEDNNNN